MRKFFVISSLSSISVLTIILIYVSIFGIKTKQFNKFINGKVNEFNSKIKLETDDIFFKLNLIERTIKINTSRSKLNINEELIYLSEININLDLIKFIQKENSIKKINIVSEINQIKNVTNFINNYKFNLPRLIVFNQINDGAIQASANILFDNKIKNGFLLEINGSVKDASLNIFNKNHINNINFDFYIKDNLYNISNIKLDHQNVKFNSDQIEIKNLKNNLYIKGNIKNQKGSIDPNNILKFVDLNLDFIKKDDKILIESDTDFAFKLKQNRSIDDLSINSNINFDKISFDSEIENFLHLKNGNIKTKLNKKNLKIIINSEYYLIDQDYTDKIKINLEKKNNEKIKVNTKFKTEKLKINTDDLSKYTSYFGELIKSQIITLDSDNNINFLINNQNKLEELKVYSLLKMDQFKIDYSSNRIRNFLPKFNDKVTFKNNDIKLDYSNKIISIKANGNYYIDKKIDNYKISFSKKKNKFFFDTFFTSENNLIIIDEIDYNKKEGLVSNIKLKGIYQNSEFKFDDILI